MRLPARPLASLPPDRPDGRRPGRGLRRITAAAIIGAVFAKTTAAKVSFEPDAGLIRAFPYNLRSSAKFCFLGVPMKGLLNLLAKANLVQLSDEEREAAVPPSPAPEPQTGEPSAEDAAARLPPPGASIEEGKSLEDIFALAGLAPCPFPAEKLLRLLDGLRAMDTATRKAAVLAMDAADDTWTIADPVTDAQHKVAVLGAYKERLAQQVAGAEQAASTQIGEVKAALERASTEIRAQIAELERLLEREVTQAAQQTTGLEAQLRATREAAAREAHRMDKEIERYAEIPSVFPQPH